MRRHLFMLALALLVSGCGDDEDVASVAGDDTDILTSDIADTTAAPETQDLLDTSDFDGTGFAYLVVEPGAVDFGIRPVGEVHTRDIELENAGNSELTVSEIVLTEVGSGMPSEAFGTNRTGPFSLLAGERTTVKLTFYVLSAEPYDAVLKISSDSASGAVFEVAISGGGIVFECVDLDGDLHGPYCEPGDDCDQSDPDVHQGAAERCNGRDDDCNGLIDEEWVAIDSPCTASHGACQVSGAQVCGPTGDALICAVNPVSGGSELCNEIDDDCDSVTDEDFPEIGDVCSVGEGACRQVDKWVCSADGTQTICNIDPLPASAELLGDDIDNDCDGRTDEEPDADVGCSDGEREGFIDLLIWPDIAACSGGWSVGGVVTNQLSPSCGREAGDDVTNAVGAGCNVADLCAEGWNVCLSAAEVAEHSTTGCDGAAPHQDLFFVARQSGTGCGQCATGALTGGSCNSPSSCVSGCQPSVFLSNDVFGCGTLGSPPAGSCAPLDAFSHNNCNALVPPWACSGSTVEASNVVKHGPEHGGVLCCRGDL